MTTEAVLTRRANAVGPWPGFALAASEAVEHLHRRFGLDLWLVTHVDGDRQVVVAAAGPWREAAPRGAAFSWEESFCLQMVQRGTPLAVPDVRRAPDFRAVAIGEREAVRSYVGAPLISTEGRLFGSLCALAGEVQPPTLAAVLEPVQFVGRMLSTVLAGEQIAADRSNEAAGAFALAERDRLTELRNRRGWESALASEEQRARHYGCPASIVVLDVDGLKQVNDAAGHEAGDAALVACGRVLAEVCRPGDVVARVDGDEFGVLAVECDAVSARVLVSRLRVRLRAAGVVASSGWATRRPSEGLDVTWHRAEEALWAEKERRRRRAEASVLRLPQPTD